MRLSPLDGLSSSVPTFRTYETDDIDAYLAYFAEATEGMLDAVPVEGPEALERVILKAPSYRRAGHLLAIEGDQIVADAVALQRTVGDETVGHIAWNAIPEFRDAAIFDELLALGMAYLGPSVKDVRVLLRREHAAARKALGEKGFTSIGVLSRLSGPTSRSRSGRAVRTLRPEDMEGAGSLLSTAQAENRAFPLLAMEGPFGTSVLRDASAGVYFAADRDDRAVGFIGVGARETVGVVDFLVVEQDYRRGGVGSSLLSTALFWLSNQGCSRAVALADPRDEAATGFFRRFSFELAELDYRTLYQATKGDAPARP